MSFLIVILALVTQFSWSMVTVQNADCPIQFEGEVKEVIEPSGPSSVFSANKVIFSISQMRKGEEQKQIMVDVLQNGPFELKRGEDYRVQLRNGKICSLESI